jgi:hypothetical protein
MSLMSFISLSQHSKIGWTHASLIAYFKLDFKDFVFSYTNELLSLPYMDGKIKMSNFQFNLNRNKTSLIV